MHILNVVTLIMTFILEIILLDLIAAEGIHVSETHLVSNQMACLMPVRVTHCKCLCTAIAAYAHECKQIIIIFLQMPV